MSGSEIVAGFSLHSALDRFPRLSALYRASVAAGEKAGRLPDVMLQLADYLERGAIPPKIVRPSPILFFWWPPLPCWSSAA